MPAPIGRPRMFKTRRLNPKQKVFVDKVFELGDPLKAYRAAGYGIRKGKTSDDYAWQLLRLPNIKQELERRYDLVTQTVQVRLRNLTNLALNTLQAIIADRENRLVYNKTTKQYEEQLGPMGAKPGVRRQAIVDLLSWVGIESVGMKIDANIKNTTLADLVKARKLLDHGRKEPNNEK